MKDKKDEYQIESKVCEILMEARVSGSWDCKPFVEYFYGGNPHTEEPDCSTCSVAKEYGYIDEPGEDEED
jgi:hypothetical protein